MFAHFLSCHLENLKDRLKKFDSPTDLISVTINTLSKVCTFGPVMFIKTSLRLKKKICSLWLPDRPYI